MNNKINHIDYIPKKRRVKYPKILKPIQNKPDNFLFYKNYDYRKPNNILPNLNSSLGKTNFYKDPLPSIYDNKQNKVYYKSKTPYHYNRYNRDLFVGDDICNRYEVKEKISRGAFGIVLSCYDHKNKEMVAIKCPAKNDYNKLIKLEGEIYHKVGDTNPYIMNVKKFITHNYKNYLVMEKLDKNLYLWRLKNKPSDKDVKLLTMQILKGIKFLHDKNIVHGDLKPENIVFSDNEYKNLKIADLGNSMYTYELNKYSLLQTRYYRAPEVILQTNKDKGIDIWSIGCIIVELITGSPLFLGKSDNNQLYAIMQYLGTPPDSMIQNSRIRTFYFNYYNNKPKSQYGNYIKTKSLRRLINDSILLDLLNKTLKYDPNERITIDELIKHKWFII
jgi:dual specificity tyrosine-phosphorylation-regulated kinase 2/3/4